MFGSFARSVDLRADYWGPVSIALAVVVALVVLWKVGKSLSVRAHALIILSVVLVTVLLAFFMNNVVRLVAEGIALPTWLWVGYTLLMLVYSVVLVSIGWREHGTRRRVRGLLAGLVALLCAFLSTGLGLNAYYGGYPTLASVLGITVSASSLEQAQAGAQALPFDAGGQSLAVAWKAPSDMPAEGTVVRTSIPAQDSTFTPRDAYIYLPPAYMTSQRPLLPVLVLMAGQPGSPDDWFNMGGAHDILNAYAAQNQGLAPIVVAVDQLGGNWTDPLCSDTSHGKIATYLQETVPAWITDNLQVDTDHEHWSIGGLSNGGTCALQTALRAPHVYSAFLDMSGEGHPSLGNLETTIAQGFDGDRAVFDANDPLTMLQKGTFSQPGPAGIFSIGTNDNANYSKDLHTVYDAAKAAGLHVQWKTFDGKHEWKVWEASLVDALPWLGQRAGIAR